MAVLLPPLAAHLAKVAAKDGSRMTGVRVLDPGDGTFRLEATDGRRLAILRGYNADADLVELPEADESDVASEGVIPVKDWEDAFKMLPKQKTAGREQPLAIALRGSGADVATRGKLCQVPLLTEGRWPPFNDVIPKQPAKLTFYVNPLLLIDLLRLAAAILPEGDKKVAIHFYKDNAPIGISCCNGEHGVYLDGLVMPLTLPKTEGQ